MSHAVDVQGALIHTSSRVQSPSTSLTFEVFSLLVIDEDLKVVKVALTVVTPWPSEDFLRIWMTPLLLVPHDVLDPGKSLRKLLG